RSHWGSSPSFFSTDGPSSCRHPVSGTRGRSTIPCTRFGFRLAGLFSAGPLPLCLSSAFCSRGATAHTPTRDGVRSSGSRRWPSHDRGDRRVLVSHPLARPLPLGLRGIAAPGSDSARGFAGLNNPPWRPFSIRRRSTQLQDDFLDLFAARVRESFAGPRNREPTLFHDSDRGDVVLGRAAVDRAHSDVAQQLRERLGREAHSPIFLSKPIGDFRLAEF